MVKFVENELLNIKTEVNDMWQLVYQQLNNAYKSVLEVNMELADKVILREKRVNAFELRIDSDIEDFIALYNPVAVDLRFALAMLKINTNLERIGDYADSIARFVIRTDLKPENKALFAELQLEDMFDMVLTKTPSIHWRHTPTNIPKISSCVWKLQASSANWNVRVTTSTTSPKKLYSTLMRKY